MIVGRLCLLCRGLDLRIEGHRLTFDKVSTDGLRRCDIEATENPADRFILKIGRVRRGLCHRLKDLECIAVFS